MTPDKLDNPHTIFDECEFCDKPLDEDDKKSGAASHYGCWKEWVLKGREDSTFGNYGKARHSDGD